MTIKSHVYGNYIPTTLNDENLNTEQLKQERDFLKYLYEIKYNPKNIKYLQRLFNLTPIEDPILMLGDSGSELWKLNMHELKSLIDNISLEIMRRNKVIREKHQ
jgi:hypothetical protein